MKRTEKIEFTASKFAALISCDRHELARKLTENGAKPMAADGRGQEYSLKDLVNAHLGGDIKREQLRRTKEEADRLALANARSRGELVEVESVKRLGEKVMIAVRNQILNFPLTNDEKDKLLMQLLALADTDWSREG